MSDEPKPISEEEEDRIEQGMAENLGADAVLHIRFAADMSEEDKAGIAEWLRLQAVNLVAEGHNYSILFTARYNPED